MHLISILVRYLCHMNLIVEENLIIDFLWYNTSLLFLVSPKLFEKNITSFALKYRYYTVLKEFSLLLKLEKVLQFPI